MSTLRASEPVGPTSSKTTLPSGRRRAGSSASSVRARRRRSRSAGCSSAGRAAMPIPRRPVRAQAALRHAADRAETALAGLDDPLARYLLELEPDAPKAAPGTAGRAPASSSSGSRCSTAPACGCRADRVAQAYLELAVLVRALEGLADTARIELAPDRSSLWAGLFDLREKLLGRRSTTCARSPRNDVARRGSPSSGRSTSTSSPAASACRGPGRRSPTRRFVARSRAARAPTRPSPPRGSAPSVRFVGCGRPRRIRGRGARPLRGGGVDSTLRGSTRRPAWR